MTARVGFYLSNELGELFRRFTDDKHQILGGSSLSRP
jgi:hypothetical protein